MQPTPFDPNRDFATIPFSERQLLMAQKMKDNGLPWHPHVGCFVWDAEHYIQPRSPFPNNVYFILSLSRFVDIFESREKLKDKLVWIPTWHQARIVCRRMGIKEKTIARMWQEHDFKKPGDEILLLYQLIISALNR